MPDRAPDKPFGPIVGSVQTGTNSDLIAEIAAIYLTGTVCDLTYGRGGWWQKYRPAELVAHDADTSKGDGVDFTCLPEADDTYDAVCFDPPYVATGGHGTTTVPDYRDRFGLTQRTGDTLWALIRAGFSEASRVSRRWVLVKCMDAVAHGELDMGHLRMIAMADELGLTLHDLIVHHTGSGPGGHNIYTIKRARRHHSYLLVFRHGRP
jgi:hypothetical protein